MKARVAIKKYTQHKNSLLLALTGVRLIAPEDMKELEEWEESKCFISLKKMAELSEYDNKLLSGTLCPWCMLQENTCKGCKYGERHGSCNGIDKNSTFRKVQAETNKLNKQTVESMRAILVSLLSGLFAEVLKERNTITNA
jgi:hypothetical protein